ncbi:MAG: hypothetical protein J6M12_03580 [Clostridia bacterium]|nr:hypothetical protein [Clostridia bacterium]
MRKRSFKGVLTAFTAGLLCLSLLSSCTSTYTMILEGEGGGNMGLPGLPGIGGSQGGGGTDQSPTLSDHLFYEKPLDTLYSGMTLDGSGILVNFSAGLSQAMGKGKYFFKQIDDEEGVLAAREEIRGANPYLTLPGADGYTLYALKEHEDLRRVAVSYVDDMGERVLGLYEYQPIKKEELDGLFGSGEEKDSLVDTLVKEGVVKAEGTKGHEVYEYEQKGHRSAFFIANYDLETGTPEKDGLPYFALALPVFEEELVALASERSVLFFLYYRPLYSGAPYTEEGTAMATRYTAEDGSTVFALPVKNSENALTVKKDTLSRDYEFVVVCVDAQTGKNLFYKQISTPWTVSSLAFFKHAMDQGYL